jgi:prepilin-type N-terminal cleavage/methylation domain-containing protein
MSKREMKPPRKVRQRALTLLEVLCVIAVIAILAGLVLGGVAMAHSRARKLSTNIGQGQTNIINDMERPGGLTSPD